MSERYRSLFELLAAVEHPKGWYREMSDQERADFNIGNEFSFRLSENSFVRLSSHTLELYNHQKIISSWKLTYVQKVYWKAVLSLKRT